MSPRQLARRAMTVGRVLVGLAVILAAVLLFIDSRTSEEDAEIAYAQVDATAQRALTLADEILAACEDGTIPAAYAQSCDTAAEVSAEPVPPVMIQEGKQGRRGERGEKGEKGDPCLPSNPECRGPAGTNGTNGTNGTDGGNGTDGDDGPMGPMGPGGPAGPACQPGEAVEPYTWPDGRAGSRCVLPVPPAEPPPADGP